MMWVQMMFTAIYNSSIIWVPDWQNEGMGDSMKTTIEIDHQLLKQAQKALGTDTIKGTVEASLRTVVERGQLQKLADALGTIPLDLTPDQLRRQRHKRTPHVSR
jgi:Arc/MetJ family transcription regulator